MPAVYPCRRSGLCFTDPRVVLNKTEERSRFLKSTIPRNDTTLGKPAFHSSVGVTAELITSAEYYSSTDLPWYGIFRSVQSLLLCHSGKFTHKKAFALQNMHRSQEKWPFLSGWSAKWLLPGDTKSFPLPAYLSYVLAQQLCLRCLRPNYSSYYHPFCSAIQQESLIQQAANEHNRNHQ